MSEPFVAQITMFGFNFAPTGWQQCQGQILAISQNTALFSLIGTYYGGNGTSNFQLPNFQGYSAVCQGQGAGLSDYFIGETTGTQNVTLSTGTMGTHSHNLTATTANGTITTPSSGSQLSKGINAAGKKGSYTGNYLNTNAVNTPMSTSAIGAAGGGQPHNNMQPYLALTFCIALRGVFPARN